MGLLRRSPSRGPPPSQHYPSLTTAPRPPSPPPSPPKTHYKVSWDGNSEFVKLDNPNQERVRWEKALEPRQYAFYVVGADLDHQKFSLPHIQRLNAQQSGVQPL
jgi:hypothetical protein